MRRCVKLAEGYHYHIFTKSIAGFQIFMSKGEYFRMFNTVQYYQINKIPIPLSRFIRLSGVQKIGVNKTLLSSQGDAKKLVEIIAYCFMPTHIHFILKQSTEDGISNFMRLVLNSYTRYFNIKHKRKGPLWQGRFKNVLIESDEQLFASLKTAQELGLDGIVVVGGDDSNTNAAVLAEYFLADGSNPEITVGLYDVIGFDSLF